MTGDLDMNDHKIVYVDTPINSNDVTNKAYFDSAISNNSDTIKAEYEKYVEDRLNHSVTNTDMSNKLEYHVGRFSDEDGVSGVGFVNTFINVTKV